MARKNRIIIKKKMPKIKRTQKNKIKFSGVKRSEKKTRVSTGIDKFDKMINGGFEKNSINLIVGGSGSGKSIFATEFLMAGVKKGEVCLYVTFEERKDQFYDNMKSFGWDLKKYENSGKFIFLEYTPIKVKTMLEEGGGEIERLILGKKVQRIVIDSISSFALLFEGELAQREAALALFGMIRDWEATALLTLEEEPNVEISTSESKAMEFEVDSLIFLYFLRIKDSRERFLEVIKMRGIDHARKVYPFDIDKKGIVVSKKPASKFI